ncbi:MAG: ATP-binding cassette domain-containing protein [Candidatus Omnitrophota bacterium]
MNPPDPDIPMDVSNPPSSIKFDNISKEYGGFRALRDVSFDVKEGEIVGFLGPNGAGKTTAMRILSGFFPPTSGRVLICGIDMSQHPHKAKRAIGYLPEMVSLYPDMKVIEYLRFVARLKGVPAHELQGHVRNKMSFCGLLNSGHRLIGRLSKGYRQRVGLAQALVADPPVLVLDEPTTGLDPTQIKEIRELIRALGQNRAVILSTHILPEVAMLCSRVIMINQGQILASGTLPELASCLKDREAIHIRIKDRRDQDRALRILTSIPGIEALRVAGEAGGETFISFETSPGQDLRPRIMKLFVEQGISLAEIQRLQLSLEDIFLGFLKNGKSERRFP